MHLFVIGMGLGIIALLETLKINKAYRFVIIALLLVVFGIFALYSISIYESFDQTLKRIDAGQRIGAPSNYYFFNEQIKNITLALIPVACVFFLPLKRLKNQNLIIAIAIGVIILQLMVFMPGIGIELNGARGWLKVPGLGTIQPAEFFKVGLVIFLANWLQRKQHMLNTKTFFLAFTVLLGIVFFIFLLIPDLGSIFVMALVAVIMTRYAGANLKRLATVGLIGIITSLTIIALVPSKFGYITDRLSFFVTDQTQEQQQAIGRQTQQALLGIGAGGFRGQGYGKGLQKFGQIPEAQSDFIFAAMAEEIGFVGNMFILGLYFLLAYYVLTKIYTIKDRYTKTLGIGLLSLILVQMFVNVGVNSNLLPNTGLTLPFMSYGGTALMINLIEVVLLYKILLLAKRQR